MGPKCKDKQVDLRGGSVININFIAQAVVRGNNHPTIRDNDIGFRLVKKLVREPVYLRGGSWFHNQSDARAVSRYYYLPADRNGRLGFRLIKKGGTSEETQKR